jgi:dihydroorotate dehydrogenase
MYKVIIRPILFLFSPETIHNLIFFFFKIGSAIPGLPSLVGFFYKNRFATKSTELFGITFPNRIGLAAGLDKNAEAFDMLGKLGFGFVEIGTVTPIGQPGNPKPRAFRLKKDKALINRMGFNNYGVDFMVEKLKRKTSRLIIGGNIGKNKLTPNEEANNDYLISFRKLHNYVDYFVVNVSSPNTPNLRELQDKEPLTRLLTDLKKENETFDQPKPILLKIAPDLSNSQLDDIISIVRETKIEGIVASNTTIERDNLSYSTEHVETIGAGGLSGAPLRNRSTGIIKYLSDASNGEIPIVGVGGIMTAEDAIEKIEAGAALVQLYTGFIYEGPGLIKQINHKLSEQSL